MNMTFVTGDWEHGEMFSNEELGELITMYNEMGKNSYSSILIKIG